MLKRMAVTIFLAGNFLQGCSKSDFSKSSKLSSPRILALIANTPEVAVSTTVNISAVLSFADMGNRNLHYKVYGCSDPGISFGLAPVCDNAMDRVTIKDDSPVSFSSSTNTELFPNLFSVTVPSTVLSSIDAITSYNGFSYLIEVHLESSDGQSVVGFKRILASTKAAGQYNTNPSITDVTTGGASLSSRPGTIKALVPTITPGSNQNYTYINLGGTAITVGETLTTSWFSNKGSFYYEKTDAASVNTYSPDSGFSGSLVIVTVVHDNRGGVGVNIKNL